MSYRLKLYEADASPQELSQAERRFRDALEASLGDADLVMPTYMAYQRIVGTYGEDPAADSLSDGERMVLDSWRAAEAAAVEAAFGPNRYMGDAMYDILPPL